MSQNKDSISVKHLHIYSDPVQAWINFFAMGIAYGISFLFVKNTLDAQIIRVASGSYIAFCLPLTYDYFSQIGYQPTNYKMNRYILTTLGGACCVTSVIAIIFALQENPSEYIFLMYRIITPILLIINFIDAIAITCKISFTKEDNSFTDSVRLRQQRFNDNFNDGLPKKGK